MGSQQKQNEAETEEDTMTQVTATMAGSVWKLLVAVGDHVEEGQDVIILESMKMEIPIAAETSGVVKHIHVQEGDFVNEGDVLVEIE
ncbi:MULTISPECIES: acetyl-CoA carboxylase biotin carboxyl carrier protein subunit [Geobacillus]|uniref:acetyl-CoA carboxylase biotin carboxyl carrier protein subunit n=1 Tax=Geobacillus TaxID=129337 RepID=UPI001E2B4C3C|nr:MULTISPECIES: acetyl-CoA carboxylase biotin carboxyl carrier protein subunit [Geobacillus]MDF9297914.1 acetyl-CoA carboxylase biotin carboxyl carrier protein subunit [Geobacillus stearothermophilus]MED4925404.1 acetyl-CoA carboxylase biotin carboxyl carrier protein subunit [Anoxybacillus geothermalis]